MSLWNENEKTTTIMKNSKYDDNNFENKYFTLMIVDEIVTEWYAM